jgi:branched-chain amino acid aminotransferase
MSHININGKILSTSDNATPIDNGAFRYGHGLFETILVQDGQIRLMHPHFERLFTGAQLLGLQLPAQLTPGRLEEEILHLVKKNGHSALARVRLQLYAGGGGLFSRDGNSGYVLECMSLTPDNISFNETGLTLGVAPGLVKSADSLANLKSCNALIYAMAAQHAAKAQWDDALIRNADGRVIESSISNIFWVNDHVLYTPPLTEGCIAGVMRQHICGLHRVTEAPLTNEHLHAATEVFLTNAIRRIRWVASIGQHQYYFRNVAEKIYRELVA